MGPIEQIRKLVLLKYLDISHNRFNKDVVSLVSSLSALRVLSLSHNEFSGSLVNAFGSHPELRDLQVNNNYFSGTLPTEVFDLPKLETFVATHNCFHGELPVNICNGRNLASIIMNGLGSAKGCKRGLTFGRYSPFYTHVSGTVPSCLFGLQYLTSLQLAGNRLKGSISQNVSISDSLTALSLAYNALTGRIPDQMQVKKWTVLNLASNRFNGAMLDTFWTKSFKSDDRRQKFDEYYKLTAVEELLATDNTILKLYRNTSNVPLAPYVKAHSNFSIPTLVERTQILLRNNRLSGVVPGTMSQASKVKILGSNMFDCESAEDLPDTTDSKADYSCGSTQFNMPYFTWLTVTVAAASFVVLISTVRVRLFDVSITGMFSRCLGWMRVLDGEISAMHAGLVSINYVVMISRLIKIMCRMAVVCLAYILLVLLPYYGAASLYFKTYEYQYAWSISAAFMSGVTPMAIQMVLLVALLGIMMLMFAYISEVVTVLAGVDEKYKFLSLAQTKDATKEAQLDFAVNAVFAIVNFLLIVGINIAYLIVQVGEQDFWAAHSAQSVFALLRLFWDLFASSKALEFTHAQMCKMFKFETEFVESRFTPLLMWVSLFNNIFIPVLVIAAVSPSCYRDIIFFHPKSQESQYLSRTCSYYYYEASTCVDTLTQRNTTYFPTFEYSYQCSSGLITSYAPPIVYMGLVKTFAVPLYSVANLIWHRRATPGTCWYWLMDLTLPTVFKHLDPINEESVVGNPKCFLNIHRLLVQIMSDFAVLLTFGAIFPPLAVVIVVSMFVTVFCSKVQYGWFLWTMMMKRWYRYVEMVDIECLQLGRITELLQYLLWALMTTTCIFHSLFLFDTLADSQDFGSSYWVLIVVPLIPTVFFAAREVRVRFLKRFVSAAALKERDSGRDSEGGVELRRRGRSSAHLGQSSVHDAEIMQDAAFSSDRPSSAQPTATVSALHQASPV